MDKIVVEDLDLFYGNFQALKKMVIVKKCVVNSKLN